MNPMLIMYCSADRYVQGCTGYLQLSMGICMDMDQGTIDRLLSVLKAVRNEQPADLLLLLLEYLLSIRVTYTKSIYIYKIPRIYQHCTGRYGYLSPVALRSVTVPPSFPPAKSSPTVLILYPTFFNVDSRGRAHSCIGAV